MRKHFREEEAKWTVGDSELPLSYGLPLAPEPLGHVPKDVAVHH